MKEIVELLRDNDLSCLRVFYRGAKEKHTFPDIKAYDKRDLVIGIALLDHRLNSIYLANEIIYYTENLIDLLYPEWEVSTGSEGTVDFFLKDQKMFGKVRHKSYQEELHLLKRDNHDFYLAETETSKAFKQLSQLIQDKEKAEFSFNNNMHMWVRKNLYAEEPLEPERELEREPKIIESIERVLEEIQDSLYQKQDYIFWKSDIESRYQWKLITYALFYFKGVISVSITGGDKIQISWGTPNGTESSSYYPSHKEKFLMNCRVNIEAKFPEFDFIGLFVRVTELTKDEKETTICFEEAT